MELQFTEVCYDSGFTVNSLPQIPKGSAVYKIFDIQNQLILLDKTSNLFEKLERYFGTRPERVKDADLRQITSRIEFIRTWSPFETVYVLYLERRRIFPRTYRRMRTFPYFSLLKINRRQRFPRIYASRQIKPGVEYFGPIRTHGQLTRLKTTLERTFKLRPCLYNIRGNDPHPDCMYFQMHTCSRPCNNDIDRRSYLADVDLAIAFILGRDSQTEEAISAQLAALSADQRFEEAANARRRLEKIRRARQETKDICTALWHFDFIGVLAASTVERIKLVFVRAGSIVALEEYAVGDLPEVIPTETARLFSGAPTAPNAEWHYDEFCLVSSFLAAPLQSVTLVPAAEAHTIPALLEQANRKRARRAKRSGTDGNT